MSYDNPRIKLTDSILDVVVNLSDGNPGAVRVLTELMAASPKVDPQSAFGPLAPLLDLDNLDIYGPKIWIFFKDVCGKDIVNMLAAMRAVQLGLMPETKIKNAVATMSPLDCQEILKGVMVRLDQFNRATLAG